ncbi:MAG: PilZ domain-containing protein [Planctomycetota bacterium]
MTRERQIRISDRRDFPRLKASFQVRFGICGEQGGEVPGFTNNLSLSGLCFLTPETNCRAGDHLAVEIKVPGFDDPLYFLGQVVRTQLAAGGVEVACRFDWMGKSDRYQEKLAALIEAHS